MKDIKEKCIKNITINASEISKERLSDILDECTSCNIKIGDISELKEKLLSGNNNGGDGPDENRTSQKISKRMKKQEMRRKKMESTQDPRQMKSQQSNV